MNFDGGQAPRQPAKGTVPCFDPATGAYLGALPAMSPAEVGRRFIHRDPGL